MNTVLIVGQDTQAKGELAQRLSARLGWDISARNQYGHPPEQPSVIITHLVDQHDGVLSIAPHQSLFCGLKPLLVILVRHASVDGGTDWLAADLAEEAAAFTLCASTSVPLRVLTTEETVEPTVIEQVAQTIEALRVTQHTSPTGIVRTRAGVSV